MLTRRALSFTALLLVAGCSDVDVQPTPTTNHCPTGPFGGAMVEVPALDGSSYCIDSTEVTNKSYAAFLATNPGPELKTAVCEAYEAVYPDPDPGVMLDSYVPVALWPPADGLDEVAVQAVTWCDAHAFCQANGKRLCGKIGGGPLQDPGAGELPSQYEAATSEWVNACSHGGMNAYAYGDTFDATRCSAVDQESDTFDTPVGETSCEGGYPGLFDMSGNVGEFIDACSNVDLHTSQDPENATYCAVMAIAAEENGSAVYDGNCSSVGPDSLVIPGEFGIRCCADTVPP